MICVYCVNSTCTKFSQLFFLVSILFHSLISITSHFQQQTFAVFHLFRFVTFSTCGWKWYKSDSQIILCTHAKLMKSEFGTATHHKMKPSICIQLRKEQDPQNNRHVMITCLPDSDLVLQLVFVTLCDGTWSWSRQHEPKPNQLAHFCVSTWNSVWLGESGKSSELSCPVGIPFISSHSIVSFRSFDYRVGCVGRLILKEKVGWPDEINGWNIS